MILYLNNSGSRMIDTEDMRFVLVLPDGTHKIRKADYYESFGNFAATCYRYKNKRYSALAKAHDGSEIRDPDATGDNALPHIFHREN
jgi:hypothetical protein